MGTNFMKDELLFSWLNNLKPRTIENEVLSYLGKPFIVFLLGSRQVGKTSLMRRLMGDLRVEKKIDLRQILYFDFEIIADEATFLQVTPEAVEEIAKNYGADLGKEIYVFIDEIQYHPNPSNLLKVIFDHLPQFHLLVSGSSTTKIKEKFKDSLAGRHKTFILSPLSFEEFLIFSSHPELREIYRNQNLPLRLKEDLKNAFGEYAVFGGYPKVVLSRSQDEKITALESIFTSYVRRDIKDLALIEETEKFNKLVSLLAFQIGNLLNLAELSNATALNRKTLEKYLFILENTFIIRLLKPFFSNRRQEITKSPKIYFCDTGLRNYIVNNFFPLDKRTDAGSLFENGLFLMLSQKTKEDNLRYWRSVLKQEVDFVKIDLAGKVIPYEAKFTRSDLQKTPPVSSGVRSFIKSYKPNEAFVVGINFESKTWVEKTQLSFIPIRTV